MDKKLRKLILDYKKAINNCNINEKDMYSDYYYNILERVEVTLCKYIEKTPIEILEK